MDCRLALEILDVARPDSGDLSDPELAEAAAHIESHADCRDEFARRQHLDREIGAAMRDVPVPHDLKVRLLAGLAECPDALAEEEATASISKATDSAISKTPLRRRAWLKFVAGAAASIVAGVIAWQFLPDATEPIDALALPGQIASFIPNLERNFDDLTAFPDESTLELPLEWENAPARGVTLSGPKSFPLPGRPELAIAIYQFRFKRRNAVATGYLLVLPANLVNEAPGANSLAGAESIYLNRMLASRSWTEAVGNRKFVYICIVPGGDDRFRALVDRLSPRSA